MDDPFICASRLKKGGWWVSSLRFARFTRPETLEFLASLNLYETTDALQGLFFFFPLGATDALRELGCLTRSWFENGILSTIVLRHVHLFFVTKHFFSLFSNQSYIIALQWVCPFLFQTETSWAISHEWEVKGSVVRGGYISYHKACTNIYIYILSRVRYARRKTNVKQSNIRIF